MEEKTKFVLYVASMESDEVQRLEFDLIDKYGTAWIGSTATGRGHVIGRTAFTTYEQAWFAKLQQLNNEGARLSHELTNVHAAIRNLIENAHYIP